MSSLICWCHVFSRSSHRQVLCTVRFITLWSKLIAYLLLILDMPNPTKTVKTHQLVDRCEMLYSSIVVVSHVIPSRHSEDPAKHPQLLGSNLPLAIHLHRTAFAPIRQTRSGYGHVYVRFQPDRNILFVHAMVSFPQLGHAACAPRSTSRPIVSSLSIIDSR